MNKNIHLVYPSGNNISTPDAIGRNLIKGLKKYGYKVYSYNCLSFRKIQIKKGKNILIGHAMANPITCFRRSLDIKELNNKILMQPFTTYKPHMAYLRNTFSKIDSFAAICGKYWERKLNEFNDPAISRLFNQVDLGIDLNHYPRIKYNFNSKGKRKFLYNVPSIPPNIPGTVYRV